MTRHASDAPDFYCETCHHTFRLTPESRRKRTSEITIRVNPPPPCPKCGGTEVGVLYH